MIKFVKGGNKGEDNHKWKGDDVGYNGIHHWLNKKFGKACKCEHPECKGLSKNFEWSLIKGKEYERKRENYWMLCCSCHHKYDITEKHINKLRTIRIGKPAWNKGIPWSEEIKQKISKSQKERLKGRKTIIRKNICL